MNYTFPVLAVLAAGLCSAASKPIPLWPKEVPGETGSIGEEHDATKATDNLVDNRRLMRLTNVSLPTITVFEAPKNNNTGAAVVVFPGGGYRILAYDLEGSEVCEWLNSIGVTAFLVKYRVPSRQGQPRYAAALQDAQRAVGLVRSRAAEWNVDANRIGVMGFSAGGHLSAAISNNFSKRTYPNVDEADNTDCRPDFAMLIYPAYLNDDNQKEHVAPELPISGRTPPTFIVQTADDKSFIDGTLIYYRALVAAKVPSGMHIYPAGGHGYGLRPSVNTVSSWPKRAEEWLRSMKFLGASAGR